YSLYQHSLWHRKWISFLFFVIYVFVGFYFKPWLLISISLICIVLIVYLLKTINYKTRTFKQWLEIERKNDTRISKWLLRIATFTMKQSGIEVNKGETKFQKFMMNHGTVKKRLFKHRFQTNVLFESFIKWLNRQPTYWNYFIYIILLNSLVIIVLNLSMAIVVSIICIFIFNSVFKDLWTRFMSHQFMHLYYWSESYKTKKRLQKYLIIGYCLFLIGFIIVKIQVGVNYMSIQINPFEDITKINLEEMTKENPLQHFNLSEGIFRKENDLLALSENIDLDHWQMLLRNKLISINNDFGYAL